MRISTFTCITFALGLLATTAHAEFTPFAALPGSGGLNGLTGQFWHAVGNLSSIAQNDSAVSGRTPDETFTINLISTGNIGDGNSLKTYLNSGSSVATNFSAGDGSAFDTHQSYFIFSGYLAVTSSTPVTWNFQTISDDASQILINGTSVALADGIHGASGTNGSATFNGAGLYQFTMKLANNGGGIYAFAGVDKTGGNSFTAIANTDFYQTAATATPEPATWQCIALGSAVLGIYIRRKNNA